jgi:predicted Zn-ribbon and HTH transcriptional regulator
VGFLLRKQHIRHNHELHGVLIFMAEEAETEAKTIRQRIQEFLSTIKEPTSVTDIARHAGSDKSENIIAEINHVLKSLKAKGITFKILPATCKKCNFVFKHTNLEVKLPSKCPECKSELIAPPMLHRK